MSNDRDLLHRLQVYIKLISNNFIIVFKSSLALDFSLLYNYFLVC